MCRVLTDPCIEEHQSGSALFWGLPLGQALIQRFIWLKYGSKWARFLSYAYKNCPLEEGRKNLGGKICLCRLLLVCQGEEKWSLWYPGTKLLMPQNSACLWGTMRSKVFLRLLNFQASSLCKIFSLLCFKHMGTCCLVQPGLSPLVPVSLQAQNSSTPWARYLQCPSVAEIMGNISKALCFLPQVEEIGSSLTNLGVIISLKLLGIALWLGTCDAAVLWLRRAQVWLPDVWFLSECWVCWRNMGDLGASGCAPLH